MIGFILTMPNVGSWNGKWTGESNLYYISHKLPKIKEEELNNKSFFYDFKDGWEASISCKIIDSKTNTKMKKKSNGFCGYDWMVDSIIKQGKIIS